jgi:hypothetical protein
MPMVVFLYYGFCLARRKQTAGDGFVSEYFTHENGLLQALSDAAARNAQNVIQCRSWANFPAVMRSIQIQSGGLRPLG